MNTYQKFKKFSTAAKFTRSRKFHREPIPSVRPWHTLVQDSKKPVFANFAQNLPPRFPTKEAFRMGRRKELSNPKPRNVELRVKQGWASDQKPRQNFWLTVKKPKASRAWFSKILKGGSSSDVLVFMNKKLGLKAGSRENLLGWSSYFLIAYWNCRISQSLPHLLEAPGGSYYKITGNLYYSICGKCT